MVHVGGGGVVALTLTSPHHKHKWLENFICGVRSVDHGDDQLNEATVGAAHMTRGVGTTGDR